MDATRFDRLSRLLADAHTRRQVLDAVRLGALGTFASVRQAAASCRTNGTKCKRNHQCCSGTCKRKKGKRRCRSTPGAGGCTIETPCGSMIAPCPGIPLPGSFCGITLAGKPFCGTDGVCADCASDAECQTVLNEPGARCVSCPDNCLETIRACAVFV